MLTNMRASLGSRRSPLTLGFVMFAAALSGAPSETPKYTGPGSCSSSSCHGAIQPTGNANVLQNEYGTWVLRDRHAKAYSGLATPLAMRMAKLVGLANATTAPRCLACHSLDVPAELQARTFDHDDGVSCESCHGPASNWLGPHTTKGWTHQQSIDAGMYELRDPVQRTSHCLTCHLGTKDKTVDHELIAAGHPDLHFELATFSAVMPRHWKLALEKDPWLEVRDLAVGQATQWRDYLLRINRDATAGPWPQYAHLDCYACHHSLVDTKASWRQAQGFPGRRPGHPPFNLSRFVVLRQVLNEADRPASEQLEVEAGKVYTTMSSPGSDRALVARQAAIAAEAAGRVAQKIKGKSYDAPSTLRLMLNLTGDAERIAASGERAAEQTAMALDSLFVVYSRNVRVANPERVKEAITKLFQTLESSSAFNAPQFAQQLRAIGPLLR